MQDKGLCPNATIYPCSLKVSATIGEVHNGKEIHEEVICVLNMTHLAKQEHVSNRSLIPSLVQCGRTLCRSQARHLLCKVFHSSWEMLMLGSISSKLIQRLVSCFQSMQQPLMYCFQFFIATFLMKGKGLTPNQSKGSRAHVAYFNGNKAQLTSVVLFNTMIDMYAKCGLVDKAKEVFDKLSARNVILWTTLIAGYVQQEFAKDALDCLEKMVLEGISPNNVTYACNLKACTILGATCKGGELHAQAARSSLFKQDTTLQRTLVEMYAKSGLLSKAHEVFNTLSARDLSSWNTLMAGYVHLGDSANVLQIFEKLKRDGLQPDLSSFSHLLSVCSITGMLHSAHMFLHSMDDDYSMTPTIEHYTAIIDLYGRLGYVDMARFLVKQLPFDPGCRWKQLRVGANSLKNSQHISHCY
ncbi:hypothetical protein KP509_28G016900 [Ceratopteris richardii]|uniref:Pentatricopeptide repeat-containing protein n=1 Tax=Ceratopteris richardii TaxID=49495 RepID=A0A8T2RB77_CERRI|nr:hypothetical protein KP509_28G016900 [Ceratopteris richardii]